MMAIKLKQTINDRRSVLGVFKSYTALAEWMEENKVWSSKKKRLYAVPSNLKRMGAIREVKRKRGGLGIHIEDYGYV